LLPLDKLAQGVQLALVQFRNLAGQIRVSQCQALNQEALYPEQGAVGHAESSVRPRDL
jgi:hypothetical protein